MASLLPMVMRDTGYKVSPSVKIRFRLLRDSEVTEGQKFLRLYRDWSSLSSVKLVFWAEQGEYSDWARVDLSTLQAQEWIAIGRDDQLPRRARCSYLTLTEGGTYTFDISTGEGGGQSGTPATIEAMVRLEGEPDSREVVLIERPSDGQWRLAGYGPTPDGSGEISLRVTDGSVFAVSVDDWGLVFTPQLAVTVGQTIRPTQYRGWLYRITEAGTLPETEPEWWTAQGENPSQPLGSARAQAVRYYQPMAHGPLPVEIR